MLVRRPVLEPCRLVRPPIPHTAYHKRTRPSLCWVVHVSALHRRACLFQGPLASEEMTACWSLTALDPLTSGWKGDVRSARRMERRGIYTTPPPVRERFRMCLLFFHPSKP